MKLIMENLFTNKKIDWVMEMEDSDIQPYVIQRWLAMNDSLRVQTRWLDKYVFCLPPKMYLSLAWSVLPKSQKVPFARYIKKADEEDEWSFILDKIRKEYKLSDNDFNTNRNRLVEQIKKDMIYLFSYYGVEKKYWKKYFLDFRKIKEFNTERKGANQKGLEAWGL